jgi:hypothetical protein
MDLTSEEHQIMMQELSKANDAVRNARRAQLWKSRNNCSINSEVNLSPLANLLTKKR